MNLFPNPVTSDITLTIDKPSRLPSELFIYSIDQVLLEKRKLTEKKTHIDMANYSDALYYFYIKNGHNVFVEKVVRIN